MNILYKIVIKFIYKDSKTKKKPPYWNAVFWPVWKKQKQKNPSTDLTSDFSFAGFLFLSCSAIWMPEIAYISSYKRTSYLSETGPECIRSWDFDWQVSRTCERNRLWLGSLNHVSVTAGVNYCKLVALNSVTCDLVGETKLLLLLEAFLAYLLNLWQFNIVPMC